MVRSNSSYGEHHEALLSVKGGPSTKAELPMYLFLALQQAELKGPSPSLSLEVWSGWAASPAL